MNTIGKLNIPTMTYAEVSNWRIVNIEYEGKTMSRIQIHIVDRHESRNWYLAEVIWKKNYIKMREHCKAGRIDKNMFNKLRGYKVGKYKKIYNEIKSCKIADLEIKRGAGDIEEDSFREEMAVVRTDFPNLGNDDDIVDIDEKVAGMKREGVWNQDSDDESEDGDDNEDEAE
jgi:hypothetical protein